MLHALPQSTPHLDLGAPDQARGSSDNHRHLLSNARYGFDHQSHPSAAFLGESSHLLQVKQSDDVPRIQ